MNGRAAPSRARPRAVLRGLPPRGGRQAEGAGEGRVPPLQPLAAMIRDFLERGGVIRACPPCVTSRGYAEGDLIEGVVVAGASAMLAEIWDGAGTLSF